MALGILEAHGEDVPGTIHMYGDDRQPKKDSKIVLAPLPNVHDANDPLTWPLWRRDAMLAVLLFAAVVATTATPLLAANTITVALHFRRTFLDGAKLTAYHLAGAAVSAWIVVPFARVYGKRSTFLFAALLMVASSAWGGTTGNNRKFKSMVWARVLQGAAVAPFESLVNTCVGDLYYVHERGPRMAATSVCLFAGAFMTPIIVGTITTDRSLGWKWSFYFLAIFQALGFVLLFFFVPETAYRRPLHLETDVLAQHSMHEMVDYPGAQNGRESDEKQLRTHVADDGNPIPRRPYWKQLLPFDERKTDVSFFVLLLRPFPLFLHPAIVWACLMQGVIIGWTVMVGVIISLIFLGPPLFWSEKRTGFQYTAAVIGAVLGLFFSGLYSELISRWLTKRNRGTYEPEFRILLVFPTLIAAAIGLYGFGFTASNVAKYGWLVPDVFLGFIIFSMVLGTVASAQYILDAHRDISVEAFTNMIIFKNIFSFVLAYYSYSWVQSGGIRKMFVAFGTIQIIICLLGIPMYIFGKRNRAFFHRHDLLKMTKLDKASTGVWARLSKRLFRRKS